MEAQACPPSPNFDFLFEDWSPSDGLLSGFRAPIKLRKNGAVCTPDGHTDSWVGIESALGGLAQVGWTHDGTKGYCRFWQWFDASGGTTGPQLSRCQQDADGDVRLYKIQQWFNPDERTYHYGIYDCAEAGWGTCTQLNGGPSLAEMGSPVVGEVVAESSDGGTQCINDLMGSQAQPTLFGGSDPIKGQKSLGGSWQVRSLTYGTADLQCSEYVSPTHTDDTFRTYDSNT